MIQQPQVTIYACKALKSQLISCIIFKLSRKWILHLRAPHPSFTILFNHHRHTSSQIEHPTITLSPRQDGNISPPRTVYLPTLIHPIVSRETFPNSHTRPASTTHHPWCNAPSTRQDGNISPPRTVYLPTHIHPIVSRETLPTLHTRSTSTTHLPRYWRWSAHLHTNKNRPPMNHLHCRQIYRKS